MNLEEFARKYGKEPTETSVETIEGKPVGSPFVFVDPDTVKQDKQSYRLTGVNAPETAKYQGGILIPDEGTAELDQRSMAELQKVGGFTNIVPTGKKDPYGRIVANVENKAGMNWGDTATALGLFKPTNFTSAETASDRLAFDAAKRAYPELAAEDPMLALSMQHEREALEQTGGKRYGAAAINALDPARYAAFKKSVGIKAVKERLEEIKRISEILDKPNLKAETRERLMKQLETEREGLFVAATIPEEAMGGVLYQPTDRNIMNVAHNQVGAAFDQGMIYLAKGMAGLTEMVGTEAKIDWLAKKGKEGVISLELDEQNLPTFLSSYKEVPGDNAWDTITNAGQYLVNLGASTLPAMAVMVASAVGTGGGVFAASLPMAAIYTGNFYNDQEEKNPVLAIAAGWTAAALDQLGLKALIPAIGENFSQTLLTAEGRAAIVAAQMARGVPKEVAEEALKVASKEQLVSLADNAAQFAKSQYATLQAQMNALKIASKAIGGEGTTETLQQLIEQVATFGRLDADVRYEKDFYENLIEAGVGGAALGGVFGGIRAGVDMAQWHSIAGAMRAADLNKSEAEAYYNEYKKIKPYGSISQEAREAIISASVDKVPEGLYSLKAKDGMWNGFKAVVTDPLRLLRQHVNSTVPTIVDSRGVFKKNLAALAAIMGKPTGIPGDSYEGFKQRTLGALGGAKANEVASRMGVSEKAAAAMVSEAYEKYWSKGNDLPLTSNENIVMQEWFNDFQVGMRYVAELAKAHGTYVPELENANTFFEDALLRPEVVARNRELFQKVAEELGVSAPEASSGIDAIVSQNPSRVAAAVRYFSEKGVFKDERIKPLLEPNTFDAIEAFKSRIVNRLAHNIYLGDKGSGLANLLQKAWDAGEFEGNKDDFEQAVRDVRDWYEITQGTYNALDKYPFIDKVMSWGVTMTMMAYLGKATLSSLPEMAIATLGNSGQGIFDQLKLNAESIASELRDSINAGTSRTASWLGIEYGRRSGDVRTREVFEALAQELSGMEAKMNADPKHARENVRKYQQMQRKVQEAQMKLLGRNLSNRLGYNETGYNTTARYEISAAHAKTQRAMQLFANVIGLTQFTNATRHVTLAFAADGIRTKLDILSVIPKEDRAKAFSTRIGMSDEQARAYNDIIQFGGDPINMLEQYDRLGHNVFYEIDVLESGDDAGLAQLKSSLGTVIGNYADQRFVNPQPHNLPKYYNDPHFRIITVMTRYIAALTSVILPRLYRDYIKNGSPGMRYQAFTTIAMALAFAALAGMLKDELSYGGPNPYIRSDIKKIQRNIYDAGLVGKAESALNMFIPLYSDKNKSYLKDPLGAAYQDLKDVSPVVSWADRVALGLFHAAEGDTEKAVRNLGRAAPVLGSFPGTVKELSEKAKE